MKIILYIPFLIMLLGLLVYKFAKDGDNKALALHTYWVGLFITVWNSAKYLQ